ncbi:MAG: SDR family oxidoreductase [Firmicutes bacterium]|nr:SDR family oxidoreductase [Bacillota bacterium]
MKILVLGATGMAGHLITKYLIEKNYNVVAFSRRGVDFCENIIGDATNFSQLENIIVDGKFNFVVNAIGILNNDADQNKSISILINSYLPHFLSELANKNNFKLIHISTDCVFSGVKGNYNETSIPDGIKFYDRTKALGEVINDTDITFRTSIIGPDMSKNGIGLFNWFMKQSQPIFGFANVKWTGVTTLVLAKAIEKIIAQDVSGLYHLVNNKKISKFHLLKIFDKHFYRGDTFSINKSNQPNIDKSLINSRSDFDFTVPDYNEMVLEMKEWILEHKNLYKHYKI